MRCPKCGNESPGEARFCRACGEPLAATQGADRVAPGPEVPEERARRLLEDAFRFSEAGRLQQAIHSCQQAVSLNPSSTSAHSLLGTLFERVGDREGAIREYEQVLTLSPGSTVERRRLNELMGVPAAPQAVPVSPRTARLAVTGGFVLIAMILVAAIIFTGQQRPTPRAQTAPARAAQLARRQAAPDSADTGSVAPPRLANLGRTMHRPAARPRQFAAAPAQARPRPDYGFGQPIGPGAYLLSSGGGGYRQPAGPRALQRAMPPMEGAVLMPESGTPVLATPGLRYPAGLAQVVGSGSERLARTYYAQGDYQRSIQTYRGYLRQNPQAGAAVREELAWVYLESGDYTSARSEYDAALTDYRNDLAGSHNVEAARHGVRTCESALKALETQ